MLNRMDAEKDATHVADRVIDMDTFSNIADQLFDTLPRQGYSKSLTYFSSIMSTFVSKKAVYLEIKHAVSEHQFYEKLKTLVPAEVKYGIQDAGMAPQLFKPDIQLIITPGSYLDPASRSPATIKYGFDKVLTSADFKRIGFSTHIDTLKASLSDSGSCKLELTVRKNGLNGLNRLNRLLLPI